MNVANLIIIVGILFLLSTSTIAQKKPAFLGKKQKIISTLGGKHDELIELSDKIWSFEEIAFQEEQSAEALIAYARSNDFKVQTGVAEIPTAFVAEYGSGSPVIAIMGEFDALPGLSQKPVPYKDPLNAGHGCGHNLFGVASLGAAIAIRELIENGELEGTVRFYGTPAEEKFFWETVDDKSWIIQ